MVMMMAGENCSTACVTRDHESFGECLKAKALRVGYCRSATGGLDATKEKKWQRELDAYKDARAQGVQPSGTRLHQTENAMRISEATGTAYQAS